MKKLIMAFVMIITIFEGCDKKEINNKVNSSYSLSQYESKVEDLDKQINFVKGKKDRVSKKVVGVLGADVSGGWSGFKTGGKLGALLGDPPAGAAAGLVLGAVLGSAYCWWQMTGVMQNPTNFSNGFIQPINSDYLTSTMTYTNIAEKMGFLHNINCRNSFHSGTIIPTSFINFFDQFYPQYCSNILSNNIASASIINNDKLKNELKNIISELNQTNNFAGFVAYCTKYCDDMETNAILFSLMERVYQVDANNYNIIFNYADRYLEKLSEDPTLELMQKNQLKYSINILKYSASLWKNNQ